MNKGVFVALINPGMALIFATSFAILWHNQKQRGYIRLFVGGYLALGGGFFLQYFTVVGEITSRLLSNAFFLAAAVSLVTGALQRYDRPPPIRPILLVGIAGLAAFMWFFFVVPSLSWRILVMSYSFGTIVLLFAAELRAIPDKKAIDRLLLGIVLIWGLSFFPRPLIAMLIDGPYDGYAAFHQSLYWMTLVFTGSLFMLLFALTMITAISLDVMDELTLKSQTDMLSGLLNRRGFEEGMAKSCATRAPGVPATLIVCDIDYFKTINDRYGHAAGDRVIAHFGACLRAAAEGDHLVGRMGGEEFAILLENADAAAARVLAEGIRISFSVGTAMGFPSGSHLTASFGIAQVVPGESVGDLFRRADEALYRAKGSGRDCVRLAGPVIVGAKTGDPLSEGIRSAI